MVKLGTSNLSKGLYLLLFYFVLFVPGCMTVPVPVGTGLSQASPTGSTLDKKVWLSRVAILDSSIDDKSIIEESLTVNLLEYLQEGRYFKAVNILPGKVAEKDLILRFQFDQYQQKRDHFRATDISNLTGKLIIEDSFGSIITEVESQVNEKHPVPAWSPRTHFPSGIEARTSIINDLLKKAITGIRQKEE